MKICYIANSRFPSERAHMTQIVQVCNAFAAAGHEVTLLVTSRKTDITESPEVFFGVPLGFRVVRLPVPDIAGASPRIHVLLRPALLSVQRFVFALRAAAHVRRDGSYTHLYGRDEWILWMLSLLVAVPVVWESHEARFSYAARRLLSRVPGFIVISEGIRDFYVRQGVPPGRMLVAHDAVDPRFFDARTSPERAREMLGVKTEKPVVMYIGGLEEWKGARTLCEASRHQDRFETYVVGGREEELVRFRAEYPHVRFLGYRPYRELPKIQQAADVLVIPNTATTPLSAEYTSPLKLFSYMAAKKPIVAARIPSITNVLGDGDAYFFTPDDAPSLRQALDAVLSDADGRSRRAQSAYAKSTECTWAKRAEKIARFVQDSARTA